ncbi:hypothetical protein [Heyndrickxia acidicola]|uniref:Uncharacterized protein n=1 Tax=Heyndrickxia acidicola TaxID=209389 RepID=A0ABU6MGG5_9BACI|nr:hypothetical protein [Heyndrickxia acidicola]MED1202367.1 hypothetical protein [Heyndrickxia acidicola]
MEVPVTLKPSYSGCPVGCGEPVVNDSAVLKRGERFDIFIGGKAKGLKAELGQLFKSNLQAFEVYEVMEWVDWIL